MPNFNLIGLGVSEPPKEENRYITLNGGSPYNSVGTNVLHCDIARNKCKKTTFIKLL